VSDADHRDPAAGHPALEAQRLERLDLTLNAPATQRHDEEREEDRREEPEGSRPVHQKTNPIEYPR
jgi:hypothetical protein